MINTRKSYVDIYRSLAIILVVMGHAASPYNSYLYLFHVPAFFFISGYLSKLDTEPFNSFIYKRARSLLLPFFSVNLCMIGLYIVFMFSGLLPYFSLVDQISLTSVKEQVRSLFFNLTAPTDFGGATWFLVVLFFSSVISKVLVWFIEKNKLKLWTVFAAAVCLMLLAYKSFAEGTLVRYSIDLSLLAAFYYLIGYVVAKKEIFQISIRHIYAVPIAIGLIFFYGKFYFQPMNWPTRDFSMPFLHNIITSFSGIYILYVISLIFSKISFLNYFLSGLGKRSMSILLFHFLTFKLIYILFYLLHWVDKEQVGQLVLPPNNNVWAVLTFLSIVVCIGMDFILSKSPATSYFLLGKFDTKINERLVRMVFRKEK